MGTAVDDLIELVRGLIPEADPVEWTNARILRHLDLEHKEWEADLGQLPGPGHATIEVEFTVAANVTTFDLSTLIDAEDGSFAAIKALWYLPETGKPVRIESCSPGQEQDWVLGEGMSPVGQVPPLKRWLTRPAGVPTLNIGPESNVARDFRTHIRYEPPALAEGGDVQSEPRHDDVLVMGTALRCLIEQGDDDPTIERRYLTKRNKFLDAERNAAGEFESETTKVTESETVFGGG